MTTVTSNTSPPTSRPPDENTTLLKLNGACVNYGTRRILECINLHLQRGEIVSLLGVSAIGKSTLLRCLAGIQPLDSGVRTTELGLRIAVQFQALVLQPWLDIAGHLRVAKQLSRSNASVSEVLDLVGLANRASNRVHELSGGMRTRLAFGRALIQLPGLLLLDEPYSSLDVVARNGMYALLTQIVRQRNIGALIVTHDLVEALRVADRVVMLCGAPATIVEIGRLTGPVPRPEERLGDPDLREALGRIRVLLEQVC